MARELERVGGSTSMRVYVDDIGFRSFAVLTVINGLKKYSPTDIEIVNKQDDAELVLLHVYGRISRIRNRIELLKTQNKKYAIIQYTLRHSLSPSTKDWASIWNGATRVWSYLNLKQMAKDDGENTEFNFYYAPLGVDRDVFYPQDNDHYYQILTTGANYMTEGVRECVLASNDVGKRSVHFGLKINHNNVDSFVGVDYPTFAKALNRCDYTAGLRRGEGFELQAAEGLVCGIRPILFDSPHYREWYDGLGIFIPELGREDVIENLRKIFKGELKSVTESEINDAQSRFDWSKLVTEFWSDLWIH